MKRFIESMNEMINHKNGMTLLEVVLAMTVVVIVTSAVIPVGKIMIVQEKEDRMKVNLKNAREAISKYQYEVGVCPPSIDILIEKRYLRRFEDEPFGNKWLYTPYTAPGVWKEFVDDDSEEIVEETVEDTDETPDNDNEKTIKGNDDDKTKKGKTKKFKKIRIRKKKAKHVRGPAAAVPGEMIYDIRSATEYTGLNGKVYTSW